jgi:sigma-B regulation protein RsbU (phosphoserine phosphatase)
MDDIKQNKYDLAFLERQIYNLTKLVEINSIINATLDIKKLLIVIMEIIKDIMQAEASTMLLLEEETNDLVFKVALGEAGSELIEKYRIKPGQGVAGWVAEHRKPVIINDVYNDPRFDPTFDKHTGFITKSIVCTPLLFKGKLLGVIQAINPINRPVFVNEDLSLFNVFSNQASLAVQNAFFFQNALEEERISIELASARSMQESLVPDINIKYYDVHICSKSFAAREVGGEFHSAYKFENNKIGIALGDIHEKGISGGLKASILSGAIRALSGVKGKDAALVISLLYKYVIKEIRSINEVSIFYGVIDSYAKELSFVNAGTSYPVLIRDGIPRYIKAGASILTGKKKIIKRIKMGIKPGDFFVVVTDGILNVKNKDGLKFGLKGIMKFLKGDFVNSADLMEKLIVHINSYSSGLWKMEDISVIILNLDRIYIYE